MKHINQSRCEICERVIPDDVVYCQVSDCPHRGKEEEEIKEGFKLLERDRLKEVFKKIDEEMDNEASEDNFGVILNDDIDECDPGDIYPRYMDDPHYDDDIDARKSFDYDY